VHQLNGAPGSAAALRSPLVDGYLNETNSDHPGVGCAVSALAADLARTSKRTRAVVTQKIRNNIELLATLIRGTNGKGGGTARSRAIITYCALVGAIGMARVVSDEELSREMSKTVAQRLKNPTL